MSEHIGIFERLICYFISSEQYDLLFDLLDQIEYAYQDKISELLEKNRQLTKFIDDLESLKK